MASNLRLLLAACLVLLCSCQSTAIKPDSNLSSTEFQNELSADDRVRWLNERWNYVRSFYQVVEEPYFGKTANDGSCETRSVDEVADLDNKLFIAKSARVRTNAAGVLGLCSQHDQTHQMRIIFLACKNAPKQFDLKRICQEGQCPIDTSQLRRLCNSERAK